MPGRVVTGEPPLVLRCVSLADGSPGPAGQYLTAYDPATGFSDWHPDPGRALTFGTQAEALAFWLQVHTTEPIRPWDGAPNRPLTAFTIEVGEPGRAGWTTGATPSDQR